MYSLSRSFSQHFLHTYSCQHFTACGKKGKKNGEKERVVAWLVGTAHGNGNVQSLNVTFTAVKETKLLDMDQMEEQRAWICAVS